MNSKQIVDRVMGKLVNELDVSIKLANDLRTRFAIGAVHVTWRELAGVAHGMDSHLETEEVGEWFYAAQFRYSRFCAEHGVPMESRPNERQREMTQMWMSLLMDAACAA